MMSREADNYPYLGQPVSDEQFSSLPKDAQNLQRLFVKLRTRINDSNLGYERRSAIQSLLSALAERKIPFGASTEIVGVDERKGIGVGCLGFVLNSDSVNVGVDFWSEVKIKGFWHKSRVNIKAKGVVVDIDMSLVCRRDRDNVTNPMRGSVFLYPYPRGLDTYRENIFGLGVAGFEPVAREFIRYLSG